MISVRQRRTTENSPARSPRRATRAEGQVPGKDKGKIPTALPKARAQRSGAPFQRTCVAPSGARLSSALPRAYPAGRASAPGWPPWANFATRLTALIVDGTHVFALGSMSILVDNGSIYREYCSRMMYSSRQAARKLGIGISTLSKYMTVGKIAAPQSVTTGGITVYLWTEADIERARKLLPKIANGRKTRYQKLREKQGTQPRAAALHKKRKPTTKKK
jgi:hypothetical protein